MVNHQSCCATQQAAVQSTVGKHRGWPIMGKTVTSVITQKINTEPVRYSTPESLEWADSVPLAVSSSIFKL